MASLTDIIENVVKPLYGKELTMSTNEINIEAVNARAREEKTPMTKIPSVEERVEEFASLEHDRWSRWQSYLHSKLYEIGTEQDVSYNYHLKVLPTENWQRWERQINTKYADLSEEEKQSDRVQVYPYIEALTTDRLALLTELREWSDKNKWDITRDVTIIRLSDLQAHLDELIKSNSLWHN